MENGEVLTYDNDDLFTLKISIIYGIMTQLVIQFQMMTFY